MTRYLDPAPDAPEATTSTVIVPVPAAEAVIGEYRQRFDTAASWGVPAHVTVLYPFLRPDFLEPAVVETLADAIASVSAFECQFVRIRWFGEDVLWLAPVPDEPFRDLTAAVHARFPQCLPYGGRHADVVAHLTVAERRHGQLAELHQIERDIRPRLPITAAVDSALLIAGADAPRSWGIVARLPLASCR